MRNLVIFGGSFDPVHNAHLEMARQAALLLNAEVVFVPAKSPRWKDPATTAEDRLAMLRLALKESGSPNFSLDLFEYNSKAKTNYSIDTVKYFASKYKKARLFFLIGADEVNAFHKWKDAEELSRLATPLFIPRAGLELDDNNIEKFHMQRLPVTFNSFTSSSAIRSCRCIDVPLSVRTYIEQHKLYYVKTLSEMMSTHRLLHSISVANLAFSVAINNKVEDYQRAYIAGILHDCAKDLPKDEARKKMKECFPEYLSFPEWTYHEFLGSKIAAEVFGIEDPEILNAIKFHATGRAHMGPLEKIIYASDKIEPTRGYDSSKLIKGCIKNYYLGFQKVLKENREFLESRGYKVDNPLTQEAFDLYLRKPLLRKKER